MNDGRATANMGETLNALLTFAAGKNNSVVVMPTAALGRSRPQRAPARDWVQVRARTAAGSLRREPR